MALFEQTSWPWYVNMTQSFRTCLVLAIVSNFLVAAAPLAAQNARKITLAEPASEEVPRFASGPTLIGDRLYFSASDPLYGAELWESDGTGSGTRRRTDLCPGSCSTYFGPLGLDGRVYFTAGGGAPAGIYTLDGEETVLVSRIDGYLQDLVAFDHHLYLQVSTYGPESRRLLYRSNGSAGNLEVFDQICPPQSRNCSYSNLVLAQGSLYYVKEGKVQKLAPGGAPADFLVADNFYLLGSTASRFLFQACGSQECQVYTSDGTVAGTTLLLPGDPLARGRDVTSWRGLLYWATATGQLVRSDGTGAGTTVVPGIVAKDIVGATPRNLFYTRTGDSNRDLRLRALAADGTDIELLTFDYFDPELVGVLGNSIFLAYNGQTLHVSNGTPAGTRLLGDLVISGSDRRSSVYLGRLYAAAYRRSTIPYVSGLWRFDESGHSELVLGPQLLPADEKALPFAVGTSLIAGDPATPAALWRIDPTSNVASRLDLPPLSPFRVSGDRLLAADNFGPPPFLLYGITADSAEELPHRASHGTAASSDGFFYWGEADPGQKLWESDGTVAGTRELFDFSPGGMQIPGCNRHCLPERPSALLVSGERLFLVAATNSTADAPVGLWGMKRSDGEKTLLKTLGILANYSSDPGLIAVGSQVAFRIDVPGEDRGIWATDGTVAGTRRVLPLTGEENLPDWLGAAGPHLFFAREHQLWRTDLTPAGTRLLVERADLTILGTGVAAGPRFFFVADTFDLGPELWTSDGTAAGTYPLDLRPGPLGSSPSALFAVGSRVVFAAEDGIHGYELWKSDGSLAGSQLVIDLAPGKKPSSPKGITALGDRLFFSANDGTTGRGLWSFDLPGPRPPCPADRLCLLGGRFEVSVNASGGGALFAGQRVLTSNESGVFSFFGPRNWELLIKVLDGCAINQRFWVYAAAATDVPFTVNVFDRATGTSRTYPHAGGSAALPDLDAAAFATCGAATPPAVYSTTALPTESAPLCADDPAAFCFGSGGRFRAKVSWQTRNASGGGQPVPYGSSDSGLFTFYSPDNWELMVKVLDGCAINQRQWVYVAGTTDVGWKLTVEDRVTGASKTYQQAVGQAAAAITDSAAFASCP